MTKDTYIPSRSVAAPSTRNFFVVYMCQRWLSCVHAMIFYVTYVKARIAVVHVQDSMLTLFARHHD
jgi:hypothetical protein